MPRRTRRPDDLIAFILLMVIIALMSAARPPQAPAPAGWEKKLNGEIRYRATVAAGERR